MHPVPPAATKLLRSALLMLGLALCTSLAPPGRAQSSSAPLRHAMEDRALVDPEAVLLALPVELARAQGSGDARETALLQLARANACRVLARFHCQREASADARAAAAAARDIALEVRGLILEGRAFMALQDFSLGERRLGEAELRLSHAPSPELAADIDLGYSSLSHSLGKHALAAEYAERGLVRLHDDDDPGLQIRLLRNQARALTQLKDYIAAEALLERALGIVTRVDDPKLRAELHLEQSRLARQRGDALAQQRAADAVIALAERLQNSQLAGQGFEEMGLAARTAGDLAAAQRHLGAAVLRFRAHGLMREELRAIRALLLVMLDAKRPGEEREPVTRRYLAIEAQVREADREQAADDFDARLMYTQQENELLRLEAEAQLAQERERSLAATNRLTLVLNGVAIASLLMLMLFMVLQRRSNRRLRLALVAQRESQSQAIELLQLSTGYVFLHDLDGRLTMINPAAAEALGYEAQALSGRDVRMLIPADGHAAFEKYLQRLKREGEAHGTLRVLRADGGERQWRYGNRLSRPDPERAYIVGHAIDVTEELAQTQALRERSERDALTGSYNRRYLETFERRHGGATAWAVINVDLDHFKQVNDSLGHEQGDRVLAEFAAFLQARVREHDAVVRAGGDEFLLLLGDTTPAGLQTLVERLQQDAAQAPSPFSLGWTLRVGHETLADTLARADRDMYERRRAKRDAIR